MAQDPEEVFIAQEKQEERLKILQDALSNFEKQVLELYLDGLSARGIAKALGKTPRSVTNTIQRIKAKVKE